MRVDKEISAQNGIDNLSKKILVTLKIIIVLALLAATVTLTLYFSNFSGVLSDKHEDWAAFGDFIGGALNPFFSLLALIAILLTIVVQSRELKLSTIELASSAKALKEQSNTLTIQNFENTFFQMVRLHNETVNGIISRDHEGNIIEQGRDCLKEVFSGFYHKCYIKIHQEPDNSALNIVQAVYQEFLEENQSERGHYFRNLYTIIQYIDDSSVGEKGKYIRIIRAQLSSYEIVLLFYNSLHSIGREKFKPLIEKYALLENMDPTILVKPSDHIPLYELEAYGDQDLSEYIGG